MSEAFLFSKKLLDSLPILDKRRRYKDIKVNGLILEVLPSGRKVFRVYKRLTGFSSPVSVTIGVYENISISQARVFALKYLNQLATGVNPNEEKNREKISEITLEKVYQDFINSKSYKHNTLKGYHQAFNLYLRQYQQFPLQKITEQNCRDLYSDICSGNILGMKKASIAQANLTVRLLKAIFNFASKYYKTSDEQKIIHHNPVNTLNELKLLKEVKRKISYLEKGKLKEFYSVLTYSRKQFNEQRYCYGVTVCDYLEILLLTGLRKMELMTLKWTNVDLNGRSMEFKDTKNGSDLKLPISNRIFEILKARKSIYPDEVYVFNAKNESGRLCEPKKVITKICGDLDFKVSLHDFRRTYATYAESLGIGRYTIKRLLNHKTEKSDVTEGYVQRNLEQLEEPAQKIEDHLLSIAKGVAQVSNNDSEFDKLKKLFQELTPEEKITLLSI